MKIGDILIERGLITEEKLKEVLKYQEKFGGKLGWILSSLGYVKRLDFFSTLAEHFKLDFISDRKHIINLIDWNLLKKFTPRKLAKYEVIPAKMGENTVLILTSDPNSQRVSKFLDMYFPKFNAVQIVITDLDLMYMINYFFKDAIVDTAVNGLFYLKPKYSAAIVFSKSQVIISGILIFILLSGIYFNAVFTLATLMTIIQVLYFVSIFFKFIVSIFGAKSELQQFITDEEVKKLSDKDLPVYTVLVPVYKEPEVIGTLIEGLKSIDYPQNKLDVLLLLEEDDTETLEAAKSYAPYNNWRFMIIPPSMPKTKPKACNYGVFFARGKYLTIYDAEDIPEPDQLKKAVIAFEKGGENYICFQAALNYFNKNENFLTKMFTLEYSYWFDYLLPGLFNLKLPIPLGGTSNHFDVEKLRQIGAWDPFNTTEDADLGVRAFSMGYKVGVVNSTTYEEANARIKNWIRQRSRWIKGYMQTTLVHSRNPLTLYRIVGLRGMLAFFLLIGGTPLFFLINPIMWLMFLVWIITQTQIFELLFPIWVLYISLLNLIIGNFMGMYLNILAVFKRKQYELLPNAFLNPFYWILHSISSYMALYELFTKPFFWQKTQHGITKHKSPTVS
jgi:cellulose synthase/poly-beta-1,6-N-acetylglucosamine synthase-like glycosyltransferase